MDILSRKYNALAPSICLGARATGPNWVEFIPAALSALGTVGSLLKGSDKGDGGNDVNTFVRHHMAGSGVVPTAGNDPNMRNVDAAAFLSNREFNQYMYNQSLLDSREDATTAFNREKELIRMQNAWNSPANQRALLAQAGYNPFLADSSGLQNSPGTVPMASGGSLGNAATAAANPSQDYATMVNGILGSVNSLAGMIGVISDSRVKNEQAKSMALDNASKQRLAGVKLPDSELTGMEAGQFAQIQDGLTKVAQQKNIIADTTAKDLMNFINKSTAYDEQGHPIVGADGEPMTVAAVMTDAEMKSRMKNVEKLQTEINNGDWDAALKSLDYFQFKPVELAQARQELLNAKAQYRVLGQQVLNLIALSSMYGSQSAYYGAQTQTENGMRPYRVSEQSWKAEGQMWNSGMAKLNYKLSTASNPYEEWKRDFKSAPVVRHILGGVESIAESLSPFLNGANQGSMAYRNLVPEQNVMTVTNNGVVAGPKGKTYTSSTSVRRSGRSRKRFK